MTGQGSEENYSISFKTRDPVHAAILGLVSGLVETQVDGSLFLPLQFEVDEWLKNSVYLFLHPMREEPI